MNLPIPKTGRQEYKYLVPVNLLEQIRSEILPFIEYDKYALKADNNEYLVRSIYFDTPDFSCYDQKVEGVKVRKKFRIRGYGEATDQNLVFLEIKRKYNNFIKKDRAPLKFENLEKGFQSHNFEQYVLSNGSASEAIKSARNFSYYYYGKSLHPVIAIIYDREAFLCKFDKGIRITFDKNLRSSLSPTSTNLFNINNIRYAQKNYFILEVKFYRSLPEWTRSLIKKYRLPRMALSKYTICLDSHKSDYRRMKKTFIRNFNDDSNHFSSEVNFPNA